MSFKSCSDRGSPYNKRTMYGPLPVPGSGKTLTIAKRIEYLIMKHKVRPEEILVISLY